MTINNFFNDLFDGALSDTEMIAHLTVLRDRGETAAEITEAARAMRNRMISITAPGNAIDIVGTGGDGHGTYNVSTAAAIVVAACGAVVAKHGNRSVSSQSGSSDVLAALGINLDASPSRVERIIAETGLGFLMAPLYHSAMKHVASARAAMKTRTIFNLLGPLTNPANVRYHLIGVYDPKYQRAMAETLHELGSSAAWIVHSGDGMDELTTTALNHIVELKDGIIWEFTLNIEDSGLKRATLDDLRGGDAAHNAAALLDVLKGAKNAYRDAILLNSAAALTIAGKASNIKDGITMAEKAIDSGAALQKLNDFIEVTQA